jgi:single-strand DNA-binding protein
MAKSVNQVFLIGRLTRDSELRTTTSGKSVATFSLAVDRGQDATDFFEVTAWEKTAELVNQYTQKGSKVHVQGSLQQESWEDKASGQKRSKVVVVARDVTFLDPKAEGSQNGSEAAPQQDKAPEIDDKPIDLSDIPF